ncbi:MAG: IS4 family transposase [Pseudomonadota bacterium]
MHARKVSHKILFNSLPWIHKTRLTALEECLLAAIDGRRLSVTGIGRSISSGAKEKHCIKRADRLLSNPHLAAEREDIYQAMIMLMIGGVQRPVVLVDWSDLDTNKRHFLIRAAVAIKGRSHTLYEEVHSIKTKEKPSTHKNFMKKLKAMLPPSCQPIVVTDGGFKVPWFKLILSLGWDYVGRIRGRTMFRENKLSDWDYIKNLYPKATTRAKYIGCKAMTRSNPLNCHMVLYKGKPKGRHKLNCAGVRTRSKHSEVHSEKEKEPWVLATSLPATSKLANKVVKLYSARMQIEEAFRDIKSYRFGTGLELNMTGNLQRLQILMLIGMLATLVLWLLGTVVIMSGEARHYQANTERKRRVLSVLFLGLRVSNDRRLSLSMSQVTEAYHRLVQQTAEHGSEW